MESTDPEAAAMENFYAAAAALAPLRLSRSKKHKLLSREHLCGLLDVQPLSFVCHCGSDGLRVEDLETGNHNIPHV